MLFDANEQQQKASGKQRKHLKCAKLAPVVVVVVSIKQTNFQGKCSFEFVFEIEQTNSIAGLLHFH